MIQVPCGSVQGHGEYCSEGRLCEVCEELIRCNANFTYVKKEILTKDEVYKRYGIAGLLGFEAVSKMELPEIDFKYEDKKDDSQT